MRKFACLGSADSKCEHTWGSVLFLLALKNVKFYNLAIFFFFLTPQVVCFPDNGNLGNRILQSKNLSPQASRPGYSRPDVLKPLIGWEPDRLLRQALLLCIGNSFRWSRTGTIAWKRHGWSSPDWGPKFSSYPFTPANSSMLWRPLLCKVRGLNESMSRGLPGLSLWQPD